MEETDLKGIVEVASGRMQADLVIKNARIIDVYGGKIIKGDIAIYKGLIAGIGRYEGRQAVDAEGRYVAPGFIDSHIHIESSYLSPEELGKLVVPHGTTTIIADPHEIANVCGINGIKYMLVASEKTALDIKMMMPSCVPCTPFEHSGASIDAGDMKEPLKGNKILGLGEFMDFVGVINGNDKALMKIYEARKNGKIIDGHSPGIGGNEINAYAAAGIRTDHECMTIEEMNEKISRGMYVMLRYGSACHELRKLVKGVNSYNSRRCILCTDDCQAKTILNDGHIDNSLRICAAEGLDPIVSVQMATINAAECYGLKDRGAVSPGLRADLVILNDLKDFRAYKVFIKGKEAASCGKYELPIEHCDKSQVIGTFHVKDFSKEKLSLRINSDKAYAIGIMPGGVVTKKEAVNIERDKNGEFIYNPLKDVVKAVVIERHHGTGNAASALLKGYGIKKGAIALSIAHDSHNIIAAGTNDCDIELAVNELIGQGGGIVLAEDGNVIERMELPIGGLMSDKSGEFVAKRLAQVHKKAHEILGVNSDVNPVMTLCFMSLPVIPEVKLTDMGLFDVNEFKFIPIEA